MGALKGLKEKKHGLIIGLCGCMANQKHVVEKLRQSYPYVDLVFGVDGIDTLPQLIAQKLQKHKRVLMEPAQRPVIVENIPIRRESEFRAWLPIMYGCDNFCTYCIVPYVRGREKSRKPGDILAEFKSLVEAGYKEITLLGQNVNSYGKGLEEQVDFSDLLNLLATGPATTTSAHAPAPRTPASSSSTPSRPSRRSASICICRCSAARTVCLSR